jgi:hypothetical protein
VGLLGSVVILDITDLPFIYRTLFSTLATSAQGNVFFEDPYAQSTVVQCGSGADSPHNEFNITYTLDITGIYR